MDLSQGYSVGRGSVAVLGWGSSQVPSQEWAETWRNGHCMKDEFYTSPIRSVYQQCI